MPPLHPVLLRAAVEVVRLIGEEEGTSYEYLDCKTEDTCEVFYFTRRDGAQFELSVSHDEVTFLEVEEE